MDVVAKVRGLGGRPVFYSGKNEKDILATWRMRTCSLGGLSVYSYGITGEMPLKKKKIHVLVDGG